MKRCALCFMVLVCVVNASSQSKRGRAGGSASLADQSVAAVKDYFERQFTKCGDSYYSGFHNYDEQGINQYKNPRFVIARVNQLSSADRLNGISWSGQIDFVYEAMRIYNRGWSSWRNYNHWKEFTFNAIKLGNRWQIESDQALRFRFYQKVSCSDIGSGANTANTPSRNMTPVRSNGQIFSLPLLAYVSSSWDEYGPGYDETSDNHIENIYMRAVGYITYQVSLPRTRKDLVVIARLSSELKAYTSDDPTESSDTVLIVNGHKQGVQNVIPDNGIGLDYKWFIPNNILRVGINEITLKVGEGKYSNGLTIFKPIELRLQ